MAMERSSGLVIKNAAQLVTSSSRGSPRRGKEMAQLIILVDAAIVIDNSIITWIGPTAELPAVTESALVIDATGKTVLSGLVDSHTHLVWAGTREGEFEQRLQGRTYQEISAAGGVTPRWLQSGVWVPLAPLLTLVSSVVNVSQLPRASVVQVCLKV
jgi:imidazolonepropionase